MHTTLKSLAGAAALLLGGLVLAPSDASAHGERVFAGYDHCGRPVYRYVEYRPVRHGCWPARVHVVRPAYPVHGVGYRHCAPAPRRASWGFGGVVIFR